MDEEKTKRQKLEEAKQLLKEERESKKNAEREKMRLYYQKVASTFNATVNNIDLLNDEQDAWDHFSSDLSYGRTPGKCTIVKIDLNEEESLVKTYSYGASRHQAQWYILPRSNIYDGVRGGEPKFPQDKAISTCRFTVSSSKGCKVPDDRLEKIMQNQTRFTDEKLAIIGVKRIKRNERTVYDYVQ